MAVERVQEGEAPSGVIASYGFCRTTIYKWLTKVQAYRYCQAPTRLRRGAARPHRGGLAHRPEQQGTRSIVLQSAICSLYN